MNKEEIEYKKTLQNIGATSITIEANGETVAEWQHENRLEMSKNIEGFGGVIRVGDMATDYELRLAELRRQLKYINEQFKGKIKTLSDEQAKWLSFYSQGTRAVRVEKNEFIDVETGAVILDLRTLAQAETQNQILLDFEDHDN